MKVWLIYSMIFGFPTLIDDNTRFTNESACRIYIQMTYSKVATAFKLYCAEDMEL